MVECYICAKRRECREEIPHVCFKCMIQFNVQERDVQEDPTPEIEVTDKMLNELFPFTEGP